MWAWLGTGCQGRKPDRCGKLNDFLELILARVARAFSGRSSVCGGRFLFRGSVSGLECESRFFSKDISGPIQTLPGQLLIRYVLFWRLIAGRQMLDQTFALFERWAPWMSGARMRGALDPEVIV